MSNSKLFLLSIFSSIFFHLLAIVYLDFKRLDKEVYVVSLSKFEEFSFSEPIINPPQLPKKREQKNFIPLQKIEQTKEKIPNEKEDAISLKQEKIEDKPINKKKNESNPDEQIVSKENNTKINKNKPTKQFYEKKISNQNRKNAIKNKLLSDYLSFISFEINKIASKSYPLQSVRRREQGTIVSIITLNKDGKVINIKVNDKRPKRLYTATINIIKKFKFPRPPNEILDSQGLLKIKIPVNFILK